MFPLVSIVKFLEFHRQVVQKRKSLVADRQRRPRSSMLYRLELRLLLLPSQMQRDNKNCTKHHSMRGKFEELALFESLREAPS